MATDPITVDAHDFDTLETELERLRRTLDAAMQLREEVVERVAQAAIDGEQAADEQRGRPRRHTARCW